MTTATAGHPSMLAGGGARRRFRALWVAALLLPTLACALSAWSAWQDVERESAARLGRLVDILHEHALRAVQTQEAILAAIDGHVAPMDWPAITASADLHAYLRRLEASAPAIYGIALVGPDGRLAAVSRGTHPAPPLDLNDRDYVRAHRAGMPGLYVSDSLVTRPSGERVFALSRGRTGPDGQPDGGVIVSTFRPAHFAEFHRSFAERPADSLALLRLDGAVLARTPPLPEASTLNPPGPDAPLIRAVRDSVVGRGMFLVAPGLDGEPRHLGYRRVGDYPLVVVYGMAETGLRDAWLDRLPPIVILALTAALMLGALTRTCSRAVRRESTALSAAAHQAAQAQAASEARNAAEARLRAAEKMGVLGQVAAGVAHDFNNLVQATIGAARLLGRRADDPAEVRRLAALMADAGERGGRVARRMLDFARRTGGGQDTFDIAHSLGRLHEVFADILGPDVNIVFDLQDGLPLSQGDRAEFETVVLNLARNARDAMPDGGRLLIRAAAADVAPGDAARGLGLSAGHYIVVSVSDHGEGMPADVLARVGEPFFTTKPAGKGTGLGLSLARRFAEQAAGTLRVESAPGMGTTVTLWLRAATAPVAALVPAS